MELARGISRREDTCKIYSLTYFWLSQGKALNMQNSLYNKVKCQLENSKNSSAYRVEGPLN